MNSGIKASKYYFIYFKKKKYAFIEGDIRSNIYGFRSEYKNVVFGVIDEKLSKHKRNITLHRLLKSNNLRTKRC